MRNKRNGKTLVKNSVVSSSWLDQLDTPRDANGKIIGERRYDKDGNIIAIKALNGLIIGDASLFTSKKPHQK